MVESKINVHLIPITKDEEVAIKNLKEYLAKQKISYDEDKLNNNYLVRFIRARKNKIDKAAVMIEKYLHWRKENNVDEIANTNFPEYPSVRACYSHGFHKTDKQGRPIYIELVGRMKVNELFDIVNHETLIKLNIKHQENILRNVLPACSESGGKNISQIFSIIDLKGFSKKLLSKKVYEFLKISLANAQNYYPETLGNLYIINSGLVFKACWTMIKPFLDDKTRKKIIFCGSDYKKKLLENVIPII